MKKILFVCIGLGIGGTEKTLVEAINALDCSKYDITLYIRKNRIDLVPLLNPRTHVIVNDNAPAYGKRFFSVLCGAIANLCKLFKLKSEKKFRRAQRKFILKKRFEYEAKTYFEEEKEYDFAVAYDMAQECIKFVSKVVKAKKKFAFFHASKLTDSKSELYFPFDKIIGVNALVAEGIKKDFPGLSQKVTDIENYLDPQWVLKESMNAKKISRPEHDLILCSCGRISPEKGFDLAVQSAKSLRERGIDFHWFFVGDSRDGGITENLIKEYALEDYITITGFLDNPFAYMNICDIYVQPSREEAHATTMAECRILCKPIVSTDTISGKYFYKKYKCCFLTEKTPKAIAEGIINLFNDKEKMQDMVKEDHQIDYALLKRQYIEKINALFDCQ